MKLQKCSNRSLVGFSLPLSSASWSHDADDHFSFCLASLGRFASEKIIHVSRRFIYCSATQKGLTRSLPNLVVDVLMRSTIWLNRAHDKIKIKQAKHLPKYQHSNSRSAETPSIDSKPCFNHSLSLRTRLNSIVFGLKRHKRDSKPIFFVRKLWWSALVMRSNRFCCFKIDVWPFACCSEVVWLLAARKNNFRSSRGRDAIKLLQSCSRVVELKVWGAECVAVVAAFSQATAIMMIV